MQRKPGQQKQKEEELKEEREEKKEEKEQRRRKKQKKGKIMQINKVAKKQEIWDKEKEVVRSKEEAKKLVPEQFHKWIKVFGKKASKRMPITRTQNNTIDLKEGFVPRKEKVYLLSREEREEV